MNEPAWIPVPPRRSDTAAAAVASIAVAAGAAALTFWVVRTLLSREPLELRPPSPPLPPPSLPARDDGSRLLP